MNGGETFAGGRAGGSQHSSQDKVNGWVYEIYHVSTKVAARSRRKENWCVGMDANRPNPTVFEKKISNKVKDLHARKCLRKGKKGPCWGINLSTSCTRSVTGIAEEWVGYRPWGELKLEWKGQGIAKKRKQNQDRRFSRKVCGVLPVRNFACRGDGEKDRNGHFVRGRSLKGGEKK